MMLASGTRLGPYEIVAPLGAGGKGEVRAGPGSPLPGSGTVRLSSRCFRRSLSA
jgi:hypothetical protein